VTPDDPADQAEHTQRTREAYDQLAAVWSATTDEGPFNGLLERPALRSLIPGSLTGAVVLDAGSRWVKKSGLRSPRVSSLMRRRIRREFDGP
jgi:hypothetical protein